MAMQKHQQQEEDDSNANSDVCPSHTSPTPDHSGTCSANNATTTPTPTDHHPTPGDDSFTMFPICGSRLQDPFSSQPHSTVSQDAGDVSESSKVMRDAPMLNVPVAGTPIVQPSVLCSHEFCQEAALSSGSSSPDVNCNTLTLHVKSGFPSCSLNGNVEVNPGPVETKDAENSKGTVETTPLPSMPLTFSPINERKRFQTCAEDEATFEHCDSGSSLSAYTVSSTDFNLKEENYVLFCEKGEMGHGPFNGNDDLQFSDFHSTTLMPCDTTSSKYMSVNHQRHHALSAECNPRNSVDMDVDNPDEDSPPPCESQSFAPYIPQPTPDMGLAGRDLPSSPKDTFVGTLNNTSVKINPVSIVEDSLMSTLSHCPASALNRIQVNPPIWTTLALNSFTRKGTVPAPTTSNIRQRAPDTASVHTQCISDSLLSEEMDVGSENMTPRNVHFPKVMQSDHFSNLRASCFGNPNKNSSRTVKSSSNRSTSKRSPLRCISRHREGRRSSGAVFKSGDVFVEALLEDEVALYAGHLQAFFRDPRALCDRHQCPDPVATTLSQGDDRHFLPICDEPGIKLNCRPAFRRSSFLSCLPV